MVHLELHKKFFTRFIVVAFIMITISLMTAAAHAFAMASTDDPNEPAPDVLEVVTETTVATTPVTACTSLTTTTTTTSTSKCEESSEDETEYDWTEESATEDYTSDETTTVAAPKAAVSADCWHADFVAEGCEVNDYLGVYYSESDIVYIAKTLAVEDGAGSYEQQAAVCWVILNRVDNGYWGPSVGNVCEAPNQLAYYSGTDYSEEHYAMARDVLNRWSAEKEGYDSYRILPYEYQYFHGDGRLNYFKTSSTGSYYWDFSWGSPYV